MIDVLPDNFVEDIKAFLSEKGLKWNGDIYKKNYFELAVPAHFSKLKENTIVISFDEDGFIGLVVEIDLINFKIYGIDMDCPLNATTGKNDENIRLIKKLEGKDFTKQWIEFLIKHKGLIYRAAIQNALEQAKDEVYVERDKRTSHITIVVSERN